MKEEEKHFSDEELNDFLSKTNLFEDENTLFSSILEIAFKLSEEANCGVILQVKDGILSVKSSKNCHLKKKGEFFAISPSLQVIPHCVNANDEWKKTLQENFGIKADSLLVCPLLSKENEKILMALGSTNDKGFPKDVLNSLNLYVRILFSALKINMEHGASLKKESIYKSVVERSHDAIIIFDNGRLLFVNEEFEKLVGYQKEELLKMVAWDLVHPDDRERLMKYAQNRRKGKKAPTEYTAKILSKTGEIKLCHFNVKMINFHGKPSLLASIRDITEEEKTKNKLEMANSEIKKAYDELEKLNLRFQNMTSLLAKMGISRMNEEEFLQQVLKSALQVVPVAKYGSISLFENDKWKFVAAVGHDIEKLKKIPLKREYAMTRDGRDTIIHNIMDKDKRAIPPDLFKKLADATFPTKETIIAPLDLSGKEDGFLSVDIPIDSDESFSEEDAKAVESFSKIASAFYILRKYSTAQEEMKEKTTMVLVKALEKYDLYTQGHSERVAWYSTKLAEIIGLDNNRIKKIWQEAILHDIGKLFVSLNILNKEEKLTPEEFEEIKKHPSIGADLIEEGAQLSDVAHVIRHHHERWDGNGYPDGLAGEEIPVDSRIMAICDSYDAMTSNRAYRRAKSKEEALKEIEKNAGKQFDPKFAKEFVRWINKIEEKLKA